MLRKDGNGTSMVAIAKHPATHTKAMPKYVAPNLRGPKIIWVPSKSGWMFVGTMALEAWYNWSHIVHHILSQVMKLSAYPNPMPSENWVKSKCYQHTSVIFKLWWFIGLFDGLQKYLSWILLVGW